MNKNEIVLKKMGVHKFKVMLEEELKSSSITKRQYDYFLRELQEGGGLDFQYGLYTAYLIMISED